MKAIEEEIGINISSPFEIKKKNRLFKSKSPSKIFRETNIDFLKNWQNQIGDNN